MARLCSICSHSSREEIDRLLVEGSTPNTKIATIFAVSEASIRRHKREHLPQELAKAQEASEVVQADSLFEQAKKLEEKAWSLLCRAENEGDLRAAFQGIRACKDSLELFARVSGQLQPEKLLVQIEPAINAIVIILREELDDPDTIQRVSQRLLNEAGGDVDV